MYTNIYISTFPSLASPLFAMLCQFQNSPVFLVIFFKGSQTDPFCTNFVFYLVYMNT